MQRARRSSWRWIPFVILLLAILYRGWILLRYSVQYVDDDQALLWNATAAYARFIVPEPFFWGQAYNAMLEAAVAAPLYWLRVPLHYALPIAAMLISAFPYGLIAALFYRKKHAAVCCLVLCAYLLMGWQWDILTSIPRTFLAGIPFAVMGALLINSGKSGRSAFAGGLLAVTGAAMTHTALIPAGLGYLFWLLACKQKRKTGSMLALGSALGVLGYILAKNFYTVNTEYSLHPDIPISFSRDIFESNLKRLPDMLSDFVFSNAGIVFVLLLLILGMFAFYLWKRRWISAVLLASDITLFFVLLALNYTGEYIEDSILYSQTRMFLYLTYSLLLICWLDCLQYGVPSVPKKARRIVIIGFSLLALISCCYKMTALTAQIDQPESVLHHATVVIESDVEGLLEQCAQVAVLAEKHQADVILVNKNRTFAYAFDALHFGDYIVYHSLYDRRTWNYVQMLQRADHRCIVVDFPSGVLSTEFVQLTDQAVTDYVRERWGLNRRP